MKQINANVSLKIAKNPLAENLDDKEFLELNESATQITYNMSVSKQDLKYYSNGGETTSIITGRQQSLSISIDYDSEDPLHVYLMNLCLNKDFNSSNNQYIMLVPPGNIKKKIYGKACFQFKTAAPNAEADQLIKLEFDIFPQDKAFIIEEIEE